MSMTRADIDAVQLWCRNRVPESLWEQHRCEAMVTGRHIDVVDCRREAGGWTRTTLARLRYQGGKDAWTLYFRDADGSFHVYRHLPPLAELRDILTFLSADRDPLFWA